LEQQQEQEPEQPEQPEEQEEEPDLLVSAVMEAAATTTPTKTLLSTT
jgi:hypothetical protein